MGVVSRVTRPLNCPNHFVLEIDSSGQSCEALIVLTFGSLFTYLIKSCRCCRLFQEDNGRRKTPQRSRIGVHDV